MVNETIRAALIEMLGKEHVVFEGSRKENLAKTMIPDACTTDIQPSLFVFPERVEEVRRIVELANEFRVPIWPCSRGNNWGYGTMTTTFSGGILINLERMNRIHHVDSDLAYAVVEPGVSYRQLNQYLKDNNIDLMIDCNDSSPECSVIGNALERGIGLTPYADHYANLCGLDVVLANGEIVQTGGGPLENHRNYHCYKWGTGPYLEGIFSQGNFGVVVKAGIWLMPKPERHCCFVLEIDDDNTYYKAVDAIRKLILQDVIKSRIHLINDFGTLTLISQYPYEQLNGKTYLDEEAMAQIRKANAMSRWSVLGGLWGTRAQLRVNQKIIKRALKGYGRLRFIGSGEVKILDRLLEMSRKPGISSVVAEAMIRMASGKTGKLAEVFKNSFYILTGNPTEFFVRHAYLKASVKTPDHNIQPTVDGAGGLWLAPLVPNTSEDVRRVNEEVRSLFYKHGFDFHVAQLICPRASIYLLCVWYNKQDNEETARAIRLYEEACALTLKLGYQQYRTSTHYQDRILKCNEPWLNFLNDLKSGADPNNIMAPGKYGIHAKS